MAFEKGNKYAQQWTLENALPRFEDALTFAETNETCLCMQDAVYQSGIPSVTFYYLIDNHAVLKSLKQDINDAIIRRVNRLALNPMCPVPASPAIWRMKQLGERDEQHINTTGTTKTEIHVSSDIAKKKLDEMIEKFNEEV